MLFLKTFNFFNSLNWYYRLKQKLVQIVMFFIFIHMDYLFGSEKIHKIGINR